VFCAIECGVAINPDSIEAQMQGGIAHGLSAAMWGQVLFKAGVPQVSNFNQYRLVRLADMPTVSVKIVDSSAAPGGVGETGVPCVAPAVANAFARLTGIRVRSLPFSPGATMGDL
jgi:isoquinoline 1-oxidoreductase beta subunit